MQAEVRGSVGAQAEIVEREVGECEERAAQGKDAAGTLDEDFVALDTRLEFADATGLAVAEQGFHLRFELGEIGEHGGFE
jgi:hypothetical protein